MANIHILKSDKMRNHAPLTKAQLYEKWIREHDNTHPEWNRVWNDYQVLIEIERQKHD
jgi:hypothetical protein